MDPRGIPAATIPVAHPAADRRSVVRGCREEIATATPIAAGEKTGERISVAFPIHRRPSMLCASRGNRSSWIFSASWCLTCQFNERTAINVPAVRKLLREKGITAMKGDWTNSDPAITAALKSFGRVGVPLVVYYPPGKGSAPVVLSELLTEKIVLDALDK